MSQVKPDLGFWSDQNNGIKRILHLAVIVACTLASSGCGNLRNLSPSNASAKQQGVTLASSLPSATVGKAYSTALLVREGAPPYLFEVSQGVLPTGLALNPETGNITGIPSQTGTFGFMISVAGTLLKGSGSRAYTIVVDPCNSCIKVTVSASSSTVTPGGQIQFTATVSDTSNTAVTWSASSGSISARGLFTAPVVDVPATVTVTATSAGQPSSHASVTVAVEKANLTISTTSIPTATSGVLYYTPLVAAEGQPPYEWSVTSGSLPAGLQLISSSGTLSGVISQSGSFTFGIRVTDAAAHTAQQDLTLLVSSSKTGCGPPTYSCSRTDLLPAKLVNPVPTMGNLSGAGRIITDPSFGSHVARITDAATNPGMMNRTYSAGQGGSSDANIWNVDSTLLFIYDTGGGMFPMAFDPPSMKAARLYTSSYPVDGGLKLDDDGGVWSFRDPNVLYTFGPLTPTLSKYDFSDRVNPPTPTPLFDFRSGSHCLPAGFKASWSTVGGGNSDDTVFGVAYSDKGGQGTGVYAVAYKVGEGCTLYNTQTGQVTGDWGTRGTVTVPDRFTIHNVKLSKDGNWLVIVSTTCFAGPCDGVFFWQVGTTTVNACGKIGCGGHWSEGYTTWINSDGTPNSGGTYQTGQYKARKFSSLGDPREVISQFPAGLQTPFDQHASWNNVDPADSYPFFSSTWTPDTSDGKPWYNEILGMSPVDGTVWRFAHTYITAASHRFGTQYAIGGVSQDGRFFAFSSDWMGTLGSESGSPACTIGTDCRGDVFVVELK